MRTAGRTAAVLFCLSVGRVVLGGFPSTVVFLPSVGRIAGRNGAEFFTTIWVTNLTSAPETFTFEFLKAGQANPSPTSFSDTLQPGETKEYENVVEAKLGLHSALGAARVTSTGEILVAERIFDQPPGAGLGETQGLFFAGVPASFAISSGESASIQGVNQGGAENFRYNFALVETAGSPADVNVQVFDGSGVLLGQKAFPLLAFEQIQPNVAEVAPGFSSTNARITATVTGGSGRVLIAGAQVANVSQDSSGFEMGFRTDLLGGGGGGGGLSAVAHDPSLAGAGTAASPLAIANGQVVRSLNGLHDAVTLAAGSNVTITPSGSTLTIAATGAGGGGGLASVSHDATLTGNGTGGAPLGLAVPVTISTTNAAAIQVAGSFSGAGANRVVSATLSGNPSGEGAAVYGEVASGTGGDNNFYALEGIVHGNKVAINAVAESGAAVTAHSQSGRAIDGSTGSGVAVRGNTSSTSNDAAGVLGSDGTGLAGITAVSAGVRGESNANIGVVGLSQNFAVVGRLKSGVQGELATHREGKDFGVYTLNDAKFGSAVVGSTLTVGTNAVVGSNLTVGAALTVGGNASLGQNLVVGGSITAGTKDFRIDHPLDPENRYLVHASIESDQMKNVYDGVVTLDQSGLAVVSLPDWFESLNGDFRYQLTAIGCAQPALYVAREIEGNRFTIAGGVPGARVSWQVSGVRRDAFARAHPLTVEAEKTGDERGRYLHPEAFGRPAGEGILAVAVPAPQ